MKTTTKYTFKDKDGDLIRIEYDHYSCGCCIMGCGTDDLKVFEDGEACLIEINGAECKRFIMGVLEGEYQKIEQKPD